jgi:hypothetical protein
MNSKQILVQCHFANNASHMKSLESETEVPLLSQPLPHLRFNLIVNSGTFAIKVVS